MAETYMVGDIVEWKREGTPGVYRCRVLAVRAQGVRCITIQVLRHMWYKDSPLVGTHRGVSIAALRKVQA